MAEEDANPTVVGSAEPAEEVASQDVESSESPPQDAKTEVQPQAAAFSDLEENKVPGQPSNLDFILDVPLKVTAQLGSTRMLVRDLLQLGQGSVVEMDKLAGEPLEVFISGKLIARGEVVVVNEKFGIRLTDIVSPVERIQQLSKGS